MKSVTTSQPFCYLSLDFGIAAMGTKGASVHVRSICDALSTAGCQVHLHCSRIGGEWTGGRKGGVLCHEHPLPADLHRLQKSLRNIYGPGLKIPAEIRQCAINRDAIEYLPGVFKQIEPIAVLERLSLMGIAGIRAAKADGVPHMLEVNALLSEEAKTFRSLQDQETARIAEDEVLQGTARIFCVSAPLAAAIALRGVDPAKIEVLPNGFDADVFSPRDGGSAKRALGLEGRFVVGLVGSLKPWHGVATLLDAFSLLALSVPEAALLIVGDGPESDRVAEFARTRPDLKVVATGAVSHDEVAEHIAGCDVATAPYDAAENFYFSPMKIFEYFAMERPVVATPQGQISEIIRDDDNGLLVPPGNAAALAAALERLARDPAQARRLAVRGRESASARTWVANAARLLECARGLRA